MLSSFVVLGCLRVDGTDLVGSWRYRSSWLVEGTDLIGGWGYHLVWGLRVQIWFGEMRVQNWVGGLKAQFRLVGWMYRYGWRVEGTDLIGGNEGKALVGRIEGTDLVGSWRHRSGWLVEGTDLVGEFMVQNWLGGWRHRFGGGCWEYRSGWGGWGYKSGMSRTFWVKRCFNLCCHCHYLYYPYHYHPLTSTLWVSGIFTSCPKGAKPMKVKVHVVKFVMYYFQHVLQVHLYALLILRCCIMFLWILLTHRILTFQTLCIAN